MTTEQKSVVTWTLAPPGYEITYHVVRGYDSPDRWYEARFNGKMLEGVNTFTTVEEAKRAVLEHAKWDNETDGRLGHRSHRL